jgi:8-amino-7-oxononanoate synthase
MYELFKQYCEHLKDIGIHREIPEAYEVQSYLDFSTNDYMCLSARQELIEAALRAGEKFGVGATGSRLLSGNKKIFEEFESLIARDKKTESALIFPTGFQANISVLAALLDHHVLKGHPLVFFDKLNHASMYKAISLSGAELIRYKHNDMDHLNERIARFRHDRRPKYIIAETVFGMDGDLLPLADVVSIAKEHNAFLYLDEAHATGVFGKRGYGLSTTVEMDHIPSIVMGTFSKAIGCSGAYVACSSVLHDYLINKTAGFIYTTAPSPMLMGAALKAWEMISTLDAERMALLDTARYLREGLCRLGFDIGTSSSHIVPVILGQESLAMKAKELLFQEGIIVSGVRPPSVAPGKSRIRIALNSRHTRLDADRLLEAMRKV